MCLGISLAANLAHSQTGQLRFDDAPPYGTRKVDVNGYSYAIFAEENERGTIVIDYNSSKNFTMDFNATITGLFAKVDRGLGWHFHNVKMSTIPPGYKLEFDSSVSNVTGDNQIIIGAYIRTGTKEHYDGDYDKGWMQYEAYIIDWNVDISLGSNPPIGSYECDGATYKVYRYILTNTNNERIVEQIKAVRQTNLRLSGSIDVHKHFTKWRELGLRDDLLLSIGLVCEPHYPRTIKWTVSKFDIPPIPGAWYHLVNKRMEEIDGSGALYFPGSGNYGQVAVGDATSAAYSHLWKVVPQSNGWFNLVNRNGEQLATAQGALYRVGSSIGQYSTSIFVGSSQSSTYPNALWKWVQAGNGWYNLVNKASLEEGGAGKGAFYVDKTSSNPATSTNLWLGATQPNATYSPGSWQVRLPATQE